MSVTYVIEFDVKPAERDRFLALLNDVLDAMRAETNFRNAVLHRDPANDAHFMLYETWANHQDVIDIELKRPYRAAWHAALPDLLQEPRRISMWEAIRSTTPAAAVPPGP
ncbi:putative quinol monooxygenase [Chelatococcus asaccharovorans]|uniref:Quinol monooxygenase YgiN n=1 Tax=Chelatococcus asaccharovorans TaxID=28210 RepID=A0A2V3U9F2_9HYPH|nr:putative quinol monooxygenase [Chelatococcus asaccharovorans]MBS7705570.1 antibiotic biosynthesis monooxygenase [Chelatococcus asaccharovorans]PXW60020.1 quinol monooxygenase YgiN [Chelatococcus asaccharovorans]